MPWRSSTSADAGMGVFSEAASAGGWDLDEWLLPDEGPVPGADRELRRVPRARRRRARDQTGRHPWLREEKLLLRELVGTRVPTLGVCLGAQLIAEAAGAVVGRAARPDHDTKDSGFFKHIARPYRRMLVWSMTHRWAIVAFSLAVFLSTIPLFMLVGKSFLPQDDQSEFEVTVKLPPGSSLEGSSEFVKNSRLI